MATTLLNRRELRLAFYRLTGLSDDDGVLREHEANAGDTVDGWLQEGLWEAQSWYLSHADPNLWVKRLGPLDVEPAEDGGGLRYTILPTDCLRVAGDQENSALRYRDGKRWGIMKPPEMEGLGATNSYHVEDRRLYYGRFAGLPHDGLWLKYHYRHPLLTADSETEAGGVIDFPTEDRRLIPALAARIATEHPSYPGSMERAMFVHRRVDDLQKRIYTRARRTREPRKVRHPRALGSHWMSTGR